LSKSSKDHGTIEVATFSTRSKSCRKFQVLGGISAESGTSGRGFPGTTFPVALRDVPRSSTDARSRIPWPSCARGHVPPLFATSANVCPFGCKLATRPLAAKGEQLNIAWARNEKSPAAGPVEQCDRLLLTVHAGALRSVADSTPLPILIVMTQNRLQLSTSVTNDPV
jgi:hypothetical protein